MHNSTVSPMRNFTGVSAVCYHYCVHVIESVLRSGTRCAACPTKALALSSPEDPGQGAAATRLAGSCLREYGTSAMHRKEEESGRVEKAGGGGGMGAGGEGRRYRRVGKVGQVDVRVSNALLLLAQLRRGEPAQWGAHTRVSECQLPTDE